MGWIDSLVARAPANEFEQKVYIILLYHKISPKFFLARFKINYQSQS